MSAGAALPLARAGHMIASRYALAGARVVVAAVAAVMAGRRIGDTLREVASTEREHTADTFAETDRFAHAEPAILAEETTLLEATSLPGFATPVIGELEAQGVESSNPFASAESGRLLNSYDTLSPSSVIGAVRNVKLAVDIAHFVHDALYDDSPPDIPEPTWSRYGRGRTLAETPVTTHATASMPPPSGQDPEESEVRTHAKGNKRIEVSRPRRRGQSDLTNEVDKLLRNDAEKIYNKMRKAAKVEYGPRSKRTIWSDKDYRFDAGHLNRNTGKRTVMFQVNDKPESSGARELLRQNKGRTHKQIFGFEIDTNNFPGLEEWKGIILEASKNPR